jgi:hypothetical protein
VLAPWSTRRPHHSEIESRSRGGVGAADLTLVFAPYSFVCMCRRGWEPCHTRKVMGTYRLPDLMTRTVGFPHARYSCESVPSASAFSRSAWKFRQYIPKKPPLTASFQFFFFSSTTLYEFWLAQLFPSIVSSLAPSVSSSSLPSFSGHFSRHLPILILAFLSVLLRTVSIYIWCFFPITKCIIIRMNDLKSLNLSSGVGSPWIRTLAALLQIQ